MSFIKTNANLKSKQLEKYAKKLRSTKGTGILKQTMFAALDHIGNISAMNYWTATTPKTKKQPPGTLLTVRSGRLIGSIVSAWRFGSTNLPSEVKGKISNKPSVGSEGKKESIRKVEVTGSGFSGTIGSEVVYALIHEFGGKAGRNLSVFIPPRPYLNPAAKESMPDIMDIFETAIESTFKGENI